MSLKRTCNKPLIVVLEPYGDGRAHSNIGYYVVEMKEENIIKTLIRKLMYKVKGLLGIHTPLVPYIPETLKYTSTSIGIKFGPEEYSKITNGSHDYINNNRHIASDRLDIILPDTGEANV